MFFLGMIVGSFIGFVGLALFVGGNNKTTTYRDASEAFDDGVSYGLMLNRANGAIIAVNGDEIMVQYEDGMMKRFCEVKLDQD